MANVLRQNSMNLRERFSRFDRFEMDWRRLLIQGLVVLLTGVTLALASVFKSDTIILFAHGFSWLPLSGMAILALGVVECLDALRAKEPRDFLQNLQVGVLDAVIGGLIILSVAEKPARLSMMIAAFLIVRGIVRITLVYALRLPQTVSTSIGGLASIILGYLIWLEWPTTAGWFLSLSLNIEIAVRGWAMMVFALWVKKQKSKCDHATSL